MKKSELYDRAILATINSSLEACEMIETLAVLFDDRKTAKFCESRGEDD